MIFIITIMIVFKLIDKGVEFSFNLLIISMFICVR